MNYSEQGTSTNILNCMYRIIDQLLYYNNYDPSSLYIIVMKVVELYIVADEIY